ncbi:4100_t:CDS:10 [Funneliformis geosporum]|nr:4100_t:CDS:10 [Funneliformis geosporum]
MSYINNRTHPNNYSGPEKNYQYDDIDVDLIEVESFDQESNEDAGVGSSKSMISSEYSLLAGMSPIEQKKFEMQQMKILQKLQRKDIADVSKNVTDSIDSESIHSSLISLISRYADEYVDEYVDEYSDEYSDEYVEEYADSSNQSNPSQKPASKHTVSFSKLMSFGSIRGKFNRQRSIRHIRMLSELKIPVPDANEPIIFESNVKRWNSSVFKKSSNNYLVLTSKCLCSFKNAEKAAKIFSRLIHNDKSTDEDTSSDSSDTATKVLPSENIILSLPTVYAISEQLTPEPCIRIDYISGPKKHARVSITSQDLESHNQWLSTIRTAVRTANAVGSYLTLNQRTWIMSKLQSVQDLSDENEENLVAFRVILKSIIDEGSRKEHDKDPKVTIFFILGRSNVYFIPTSLVGNELSSDENGMKSDRIPHYPLLVEDTKSKDVEFHRYKYPLLCLTDIYSDGRDDSFQLTFKNNIGSMKRTLSLGSLLVENIITEIRTAIDSITFWWPSPGYQLRAPTNMQATIIPPEPESDKASQVVGLERMIEAQCHAYLVNKSRITFKIEYVVGAKSTFIGLGIDHLPFRFILLPPASQSSESQLEHESPYSNQELIAIFNSLKYHPLLHEIILRHTNLFELQIQQGPRDHDGMNMLAAVIYDLLLSNPRLKKLDLTSCGITSETVSAIGKALITGQSCLERLLLGGNSIRGEGAQALASGLTGHKSAIKELDISNCKLTNDSVESILQALDTNVPEELEVLNISNNSCDLETNVLEELLSKTVTLRTLNLRRCQKSFTHKNPLISVELLGNINLTTLDLGEISLNSRDHLNALYEYIQSPAFAKIRYLSVDHCDLDGGAVSLILSYVTTSPNYEKIRVWAGGNYVMRSSQGFKEFINAIKSDWTPIWLSLEDTIFGLNLDMIIDILQAFSENTVIQYLDLSYPNFSKHKGVSPTPQTQMIAKKACEAIGSLFRENKSIKGLDLHGESSRRFGSLLGKSLSGLKENNTLEKLNIKGNAISDHGAKVLSEVLKVNTKLRVLSCDENEIGIEGYSAIHKILTTGLNVTLQQFSYPTQDLRAHNESLDSKLTINSPRDTIFGPPTAKMSQRIAAEKLKVNFREIVEEIMMAVDEHEESFSESNSNADDNKSSKTGSSSTSESEVEYNVEAIGGARTEHGYKLSNASPPPIPVAASTLERVIILATALYASLKLVSIMAANEVGRIEGLVAAAKIIDGQRSSSSPNDDESSMDIIQVNFELCFIMGCGLLLHMFMSKHINVNNLGSIWTMIIITTLSILFAAFMAAMGLLPLFQRLPWQLIIFSQFFYHTSLYTIAKSMKKSFTFGELAVVSQALTLLAVEAWVVTMNQFGLLRLFPLQNHIPSNIVIFQIALILGILLIGIVLSPFLIRSRQLAQQPTWKIKHTRDINSRKKKVAFIIYFITVLMIGSIGLWVQAFLNIDPYSWMLGFVIEKKARIFLCIFWIGLIALSLGLFIQLSQARKIYSLNTKRKYFHFLALIMFMPGYLFESVFMHLAFSVAFAALIYLEYLRYFAVFPLGKQLHVFLSEFLDSRDAGPSILSHIYLLVGCAGCIWLDGSSTLANISGIFTLGLGDSMASIIGRKYGRHRWPGAFKTIEGSIAFVVFIMIGAVILNLTASSNIWADSAQSGGFSNCSLGGSNLSK